jgi:hypothetical protein
LTRWMRTASRRLGDSTLGEALGVGYTTRLTGLAAEASYWGVFALPWLILGLVAGMSHLQAWVGVDAVDAFRDRILDVASKVLTSRPSTSCWSLCSTTFWPREAPPWESSASPWPSGRVPA